MLIDVRCNNNVQPYSEELMKKASNVQRKHLLSLGSCVGKFTKSGKFHLLITALDYLAPYAKVMGMWS